jgi:putative ABC transport system permease protein
MTFDLGREGYSEPQGRNFHRQLIERVGSLPAIQAVTIARDRPFGGGFQRSVFIEGQEPAPGGRGVLVQTNNIGLKFFDTMGISILKGRDFTEQDSETAPNVLIVNEAMAERFWPGADPVGKRLKLFGDEVYREVIAVVRDTKYNSLTERRRPFMYIPFLQEYASQINLHARTSSDPTGLVSPVRQAIQGIDSRLAPLNIQTLSERIDNSLGDQRTQTTLLGTFGLLALVLAAVGLYGVMAYSVAQRTREIGIRMALGAQRGHVLGLVLKQGVTLVSAGVVVGLGAAFAATRLISNLLFGVSAVDPVAFAGTSALLIVVALLASYIPARRATKVDPLIALRYE